LSTTASKFGGLEELWREGGKEAGKERGKLGDA
jgi:hypothetical protein